MRKIGKWFQFVLDLFQSIFESKPKAPPSTNPDAIDLAKDAVWYGSASPADYPVSANLKAVRISGGLVGPCVICVDWDDPHWTPYGIKRVMGNSWIGFKRDGRWHMGAWEMITASMVGTNVCRTSEAMSGQPPLIQAHGPIAEWVPKHGEQIVYMQTTTTRGGVPAGSVVGRSQAIFGVWP